MQPVWQINFLIKKFEMFNANLSTCELNIYSTVLKIATTKNHAKLLSVDDSIFIFLSYGTLVVHIGSGRTAQQSWNCEACQNCIRPSFEFVIVHNAVRMHELLLCRESSRKCHHAAQTTPTWTKTILTCFTKLIAVQPSMAEYEWTMYQMKVE